MPSRRTFTLTAGITATIIIGALAAIGELIAGTRFDTIAERYAARYATSNSLFPRGWHE